MQEGKRHKSKQTENLKKLIFGANRFGFVQCENQMKWWINATSDVKNLWYEKYGNQQWNIYEY